MSSTIKPRYAVEWVVLFIAEHLDKNDGAWPRDWSDLADDYSAREAGAYPFSFDELQTLVDVRWDIELPRDEQLFADEGFQVVKVPASYGFRHVLEPNVVTWNRELHDYVIGEPSKWLRDNISRPE